MCGQATAYRTGREEGAARRRPRSWDSFDVKTRTPCEAARPAGCRAVRVGVGLQQQRKSGPARKDHTPSGIAMPTERSRYPQHVARLAAHWIPFVFVFFFALPGLWAALSWLAVVKTHILSFGHLFFSLSIDNMRPGFSPPSDGPETSAHPLGSAGEGTEDLWARMDDDVWVAAGRMARSRPAVRLGRSYSLRLSSHAESQADQTRPDTYVAAVAIVIRGKFCTRHR